MVSMSACVSLLLHHKVQKFSSGTGSPGWSRKKGRKTVAVNTIIFLGESVVIRCTDWWHCWYCWCVNVETSIWTAEEIDAYQQAMMKYDKDFFLVSKQVNSASCTSCQLPLLLVNSVYGEGFFTGRVPFLSPSQQHQSIEGWCLG